MSQIVAPDTLLTHTKTGKTRIVVRSQDGTEPGATRASITTRNVRDGQPFGPQLSSKPSDFAEQHLINL